jgi:hypothetical protein
LKECAQNALLQSRERETERKIQTILKNLNEPIRIFSISADIYNQWLTPIANRPDWSPENTRVPQLRRFALGLTSQSNYELYRDHCFITTPKTILDKLDRILTKHSDNDGYSRARKQFIDRIPILAEQLQGHITACLEMGLPRVWKGKSKSLQLEKVLQEVNKWSARLRWQTFHKVIQDGGIPINSKAKAFIGLDIVNLNYDILQTMQTPLSDWKVDMQWTAREVAASLNNTINSTEKQLSSCLDNFSGNENLKRRALEAWNDQKRLIRAHMKRFESKLQDHVSNIYKYATTEEDILCPVAKLNKPYYLRASRIQRGNGLHARQLADFKDGLTRHGTNAKSFVHRYEDIVHHKSKDELMSALDEFKISIIGFFEEFLEIMQEFLITTSFLKPGNFSIREELRQWYPEVQKDIKELQQFFRNEMPEEDGATTALDEQPSGEPAAKRTKLSAKLST